MTGKIQAPKILLSAFCRSSAELLIKRTGHSGSVLLPNDKIEDSEKLIEAVLKEKPDYIFSFGQKPVIKNKVHIETTAKDGGLSVDTDFDCDRLKCLFELNSVDCKISHNAGTSYCNRLYFKCIELYF